MSQKIKINTTFYNLMATLEEIAADVERYVAILCGHEPHLGSSNNLYLEVLTEYVRDIVRREGKTEIRIFNIPFAEEKLKEQQSRLEGFAKQFKLLSETISREVGQEITFKIEQMVLDSDRFEKDAKYRKEVRSRFREKTRKSDIIHMSGGYPYVLNYALNQLNAAELFRNKRYFMGFSSGGCLSSSNYILHVTVDEPQELDEARAAFAKCCGGYSEIPFGENGTSSTLFVMDGLGKEIPLVTDFISLFHGWADKQTRWPIEKVQEVSRSVAGRGLHVVMYTQNGGTLVCRGNFNLEGRQVNQVYKVLGTDPVYKVSDGTVTLLESGKVYNKL